MSLKRISGIKRVKYQLILLKVKSVPDSDHIDHFLIVQTYLKYCWQGHKHPFCGEISNTIHFQSIQFHLSGVGLHNEDR